MPKKILVVCRHFWPEKTRINELCNHLVSYGFKVDVLCGQPCNEAGEFQRGYNSFKVRRETKNKINIYRTFDVKQGNGSNLRIFLNYVTFPLMARMQSNHLLQGKYDAVLIYQLSPVMMCGPGIRIAEKLQIPVYIYVADLWPQGLYSVIDVQSSLFRRLLYRISMSYYRKADRLIVPSELMRGYFASRLGMTDEQLPVVTQVPDSAYEQKIRDDSLLEKLAGSFTLLVPGDFDGQLHVDGVIRTAQKIRSSEAGNIRFVVTGTGEKIGELQKQVMKNGLEDLFFFEGRITSMETGKYLYAADIITAIVKPEKTSAYQLPHQMINYLAAGKPVVASIGGLVKDLIRRAGCGEAVEPDDLSGIYSSIMKIYRMSGQERQRLGQQGAAWQKEHFNPDENAEKIAWILAGEDANVPSAEVSSIRQLRDL
ncbi:MAG: glycosyltransferase family 4 protein [Parasporobacterium sp.]|nr:glycosyltransferase family 4 protein [Parasporobacterium sp.]